ncbi:cyclase [Mycobacterium sp. djl-10]|nr:cyclase [Mycobacterium sp. djl-10]
MYLSQVADESSDERAELIAWLQQRGITAEQIRSSFSPMLLAPRRIIGDDGTYVSTRQISDETGMDLELVQRLQRAAGLPRVESPDAPVFLRADGHIAAVLQQCVELGLDPDDLVQVTRTLADGLATAAEVMRYTGMAAVLKPGATELQIAQRLEELVVQVEPLLGELVREMLLLQLRHSMETEAVSASERAAGAPLPGAREVAVAFADLVGFTRLGEAVEPEELERLANHLADLARDVAVPPVRLVKTIGDAVMLVCPDPVLLLDAMVTLGEAAREIQDFPRLRVGVSFGEAVSRAGDWFGAPVNLASRVTGAARPGAVLVTEAAREAIGDAPGYDWSFAGGKHLKGVKGETKVFRVRRAATAG